MIVVDTNIIGYLFLSSERSNQSEQALSKDPHWIAPVLWRSEFRNVLATYINQKLISFEDGLSIIAEAESLMKDAEFDVTSLQVLKLAEESGCSAYDCEFIALAIDMNVPLITVDKKILSKFPKISTSLDEFISEQEQNSGV